MHLEEVNAKVASLLRPARFLIAPEPATPAAGSAVMYAEDAAGVARLRVKHSTGVSLAIFRDAATRVRNTSGSTITKGSAVYITGSTGQVPTVSPAKADSSATVPALGLATSDIANNAFGTSQFTGQVSGLDTSAFAEGDKVFVSATTAGALTNVEPVHPNISQLVGIVITSNAGNGVVFVFPTLDTHGDETGSISNTFAIGDASAGTKSLIFHAAFEGSLDWAPTAARTVTIPDASGTVALVISGAISTGTTTVGSLPAAATAGAGARHFVTDANATAFASIVAGGGANAVPVYSDGANWRIG